MEGKADVLMEGGKVRPEHLKSELITMAQLEAAARKQGFGSLAEVDSASSNRAERSRLSE